MGEREKVLPFYLSRDLLADFQERDLFREDVREEIRRELTDTGVDEWTYLDMFFKRYNKVKLDHLAIEQERTRLTRENAQLRAILKQFLDGVSVNGDVLSNPNPLLVVNGKVNLNHVPVKRFETKVCIEAATHVHKAKIEDTKGRCRERLQTYQNQTGNNFQNYKDLLEKDADLSKKVERRIRQVERRTESIQHWKQKIAQNKQECEERNAQLKMEKKNMEKHYQELKEKMNAFRSDQRKRLADLTRNARNCMQSLKEQLVLAEKILKTAELCRKFETEREKVLPFYLSRDLLADFQERDLFREDVREEIRRELTDTGVDEWTY